MEIPQDLCVNVEKSDKILYIYIYMYISSAINKHIFYIYLQMLCARVKAATHTQQFIQTLLIRGNSCGEIQEITF